MLQTCFNESFTGDFCVVKEKVKEILESLKKNIPHITDEELSDLRIIYSELLINAAIHGNKADFSKKVELLIEVDDGIIMSVIKDEGDGFRYPSLSQSTETPEEIFKEHGRGLYLVVSLADSTSWNDIGNEIRFQKKFQ